MKSISIADCERRFKQGQWSQQLCEDMWRLVGHSSNTEAVMLAYDIQHCLNGLTIEHLAWLDAWQKAQRHTSWPLYWRLLSAELELGLVHEAALRLQSPIRQRWSLSRILALHHFPLALDYLHRQKNHGNDFLTSRLMQLATSLQERTTTLPKLCDELFGQNNIDCLPARIAVVGNGPSIIGNAAGERIDTADLVIRFNKIHTGELISRDTGQQTGLWVISPGFKIKASGMHCNKLCLSGPAPFMRSSRYWSRLARIPFSSLALTPLDSWHSLVGLLNAPPSAGILVLDTLIRHFPTLNIESHGFTTDTAESGDTQRAGRHYGDCHKVSTRHNWHEETMLIRKWISMGKLHPG
ncbi:glycosyltransferase family 29 protein [Granulosicoccus antarcticus]|uniref:Uncharacterized protein n=1 Tax=Granulosicoccus antarcticus IMCC3135 TaxID=1192854 RepID=A0A2Z2NVH9_9GAMM|nr:glycosyltransferase family 29 protein [Granulosicoccus antarcticus]ASJ71677.1 hypothetical protein IMCC3135_07870 [Granulosicoccus antarcticus IMCC3135]